MAIWPFNRRKKQTGTVPTEVQEYYDAERREHIGVAWLIALLSLAVSIAVFAGLFFGGRWAYRKIAGTEDKSKTTSQTEKKTDSNNEAETKPDSESGTDAPATPNSGATGTATTPPQTSSTNTTTPQAAPASGNLPQTGPDSDE